MRAPSDAVDAAVLDQLQEDLGGEVEVLQEIVGIFLGEMPGHVATIREASARGDKEAILQAAHTLKSTAATFGARRLSELCAVLESSPGRGPALAEELASEAERVRVVLAARLPA